MKKLLSLLGSLGLVATASMGVVACGDNSLPGDGGNTDDSATTYSGSFSATFKAEPSDEQLANDFAIDGVSNVTYHFQKDGSETNTISLDDTDPKGDDSKDTPGTPTETSVTGTVSFSYQAKEEVKEVKVTLTPEASNDLDAKWIDKNKEGVTVPVKAEPKVEHVKGYLNVKLTIPNKKETDAGGDYYMSRAAFLDAMTESQAWTIYFDLYKEEPTGNAKDALKAKNANGEFEYGPVYQDLKISDKNYDKELAAKDQPNAHLAPNPNDSKNSDYHAPQPGKGSYELGFYACQKGDPDKKGAPDGKWFWFTFDIAE